MDTIYVCTWRNIDFLSDSDFCVLGSVVFAPDVQHEDTGNEQQGHHQHRHGSNLDKTEYEDAGGEQLRHHQHRVPPR